MRAAASGRAVSRAASAIAAIRCGAPQQGRHFARQPRAVQLRVRHDRRRARLRHVAGVAGLVVRGRVRVRNEDRGSPAAATSSTEPPAARHPRSAAASASANGSTYASRR